MGYYGHVPIKPLEVLVDEQESFKLQKPDRYRTGGLLSNKMTFDVIKNWTTFNVTFTVVKPNGTHSSGTMSIISQDPMTFDEVAKVIDGHSRHGFVYKVVSIEEEKP